MSSERRFYMDSGYNQLSCGSDALTSEYYFILAAFNDCIAAASQTPYESVNFLPHRDFMRKYPILFDDAKLFEQLYEKVISYVQSHTIKTRALYTRTTNANTFDDINKMGIELQNRKYRIHILHFLIVILRMEIDRKPSLLKTFTCYDIYTKLLFLLCVDSSLLALNLSNLFLENKLKDIDMAQLLESSQYLHDIYNLNKMLKELWPILRNIMTEHTLSSSEKIVLFGQSFKKYHFWLCYRNICLFYWKYLFINHKLGAVNLDQDITQTNQFVNLFLETDSDTIIQLFDLDKEQTSKEILELKNTIKTLSEKIQNLNASKDEKIHSAACQYYLQHAIQINNLTNTIEQIAQSDHNKVSSHQKSFEILLKSLSSLATILASKQNFTFNNYKKTIDIILEFKDFLRPVELIQLLPHIIKINELWLNYFKTTTCDFIGSLLLERHSTFQDNFSNGFAHAEDSEANRHQKNTTDFARELINAGKNISLEQAESKQAAELVSALMSIHQDIFDDDEAATRIHGTFNDMLCHLRKLANETSVQHIQKCANQNDAYETSRFTIVYALQRINAHYLFISHVLKHPNLSSSPLLLEFNLHLLFRDAFEIGNLITRLLIENQNKIPTEKIALLHKKLESIQFLDNKHWKKNSTTLYQKIQKYAQAAQSTKKILDNFKVDLWTHQVDALLFRSRYAHLKVMNKDKNQAQFVLIAQEQKKLFDQQSNFIAKFCNISLEQQQKDIQNINVIFNAIQPKPNADMPITVKKKIETPVKTPSISSKSPQITSPLPKNNSQNKKPAVESNSAVQPQPQPVIKKTNTSSPITNIKPKVPKKPLHQQTNVNETPTQQLINYPSIPSVSYDIYDFVELPVKINNNTNKKIKKTKIKPENQPQVVIQETQKADLCLSIEDPIAKFKTSLSIEICPDVKAILRSLTQEGAIAFIRGGYIRSKYYKKPANDADIVTTLEPTEIIRKLENLGYSCKQANKLEDLTLFTCRKKEGKGLPIDISFSTLPLEQEAEKSDITINSFICFEDGVIIDFLGAIDDLEAPELKMVSNDEEKFKNNPKKYLRLIRFAAEYKKTIPAAIIELMHKYAHIISELPYPVYVDHFKTLFLKGYATEVLALLINHNLYSIISTQLTKESFDQILNLRIFLNWHFTQIDNAIKFDEKNKKQYKIEQIFGLLLLPILVTSPNLSAKKIAKMFIAQHDKELASEDKHMLIKRIEHNLLHYKELYSPSLQDNTPCRDITNNMAELAITYQFSNLNINQEKSENNQLIIYPKRKKNG